MSRFRVEITAGPLKGTLFTFEEHDTFIFGRAPDCHARLSPQDTTASRHHFLLEVNPPRARIRDLGSRNGTFVNGTRYGGRGREETPEDAAGRSYPEVDIRHGDVIRVGDTSMTVSVETIALARTETFVADTELIEDDPPTAIVVSAEPEQPGLVVPGYDLGEKLGEGGMGAVYAARRRYDGASAAVKLMLPKVATSERARQSFLREIDVIRQLRHRNVVELYEFGAAGHLFYFAMELCSGGSVQDLLARRGVLPAEEAVPIILDVLAGLAVAHERGMVHRDIKPQNILLTAASGGTPKLSDFGLAKSFDKAGFSGFTVTGTAAGTLRFMSRDQLVSFKYTRPASDVWSVGATLYYMMTGCYSRDFPPERSAMEVILREPVVPIRQRDARIPPRIAAVIDRALEDDVERRYPDAAALRAALLEAL